MAFYQLLHDLDKNNYITYLTHRVIPNYVELLITYTVDIENTASILLYNLTYILLRYYKKKKTIYIK